MQRLLLHPAGFIGPFRSEIYRARSLSLVSKLKKTGTPCEVPGRRRSLRRRNVEKPADPLEPDDCSRLSRFNVVRSSFCSSCLRENASAWVSSSLDGARFNQVTGSLQLFASYPRVCHRSEDRRTGCGGLFPAQAAGIGRRVRAFGGAEAGRLRTATLSTGSNEPQSRVLS